MITLKKESLFMRFYYKFSLFNIDLVNAKTGRILSKTDKAINITANLIASLFVYLTFTAIILALFYSKVEAKNGGGHKLFL